MRPYGVCIVICFVFANDKNAMNMIWHTDKFVYINMWMKYRNVVSHVSCDLT